MNGIRRLSAQPARVEYLETTELIQLAARTAKRREVAATVALIIGACWAMSAAANAQTGASPAPDYNSARLLKMSVAVNVDAHEAWNAWTTRDGLKTFLGEDNRVELRPGGPFEIYFLMKAPEGMRGSEGCTVLSFIPDRMLSFTWNAPPSIPKLRDAKAHTQVVLEFRPRGAHRTEISLTQQGFGVGEDWDKYYEYFDRAWGHVLESLKERLNKGAAPETKNWVYLVYPTRPGFFEQATPEEEQIISRHAGYIQKLAANGVVIAAGPCFDPFWFPEGPNAQKFDHPAPGIVMFEAPDEGAAKAIMNGDPAIQAGIFAGKLTTFHLAFQRQ